MPVQPEQNPMQTILNKLEGGDRRSIGRSEEVVKAAQPVKLEDIPNIGKSIAADLRAIGILHPEQLAKMDPLATYHALSEHMAHRSDPCVLYTLMAARHFMECGEPVPWWKFTGQGKKLLAAQQINRKP